MEEEISFWREKSKYDSEKAEANRKKYMTNTLDTNKKMELYNCSVNGNIEKFKELIDVMKYPIMEECSAGGYFWTVIHYAAHYGFDNIIEYILEKYQNHPDKKTILNLQSSLGQTPLVICLVNSGNKDKKKKILELFAMYDAIDFSICTNNDEDIFDICKKHGLAEHLLSLIKED
jgi:hypothetical protein